MKIKIKGLVYILHKVIDIFTPKCSKCIINLTYMFKMSDVHKIPVDFLPLNINIIHL
jgi:hypothetical protein